MKYKVYFKNIFFIFLFRSLSTEVLFGSQVRENRKLKREHSFPSFVSKTQFFIPLKSEKNLRKHLFHCFLFHYFPIFIHLPFYSIPFIYNLLILFHSIINSQTKIKVLARRNTGPSIPFHYKLPNQNQSFGR